MRGNLRAAARPHLVLDLLREYGQLVFGDRPALAGPPHAVDYLVPGEGLGGAASLGHHQDHRLLRGEPAPARGTGAPPADRGAVVGGAAVDDPAVRIPAIRTEHAITSRTPPRSRFFRTQLVDEPHPCNYYMLCLPQNVPRRNTRHAATPDSRRYPVMRRVAGGGARRVACSSPRQPQVLTRLDRRAVQRVEVDDLLDDIARIGPGLIPGRDRPQALPGQDDH